MNMNIGPMLRALMGDAVPTDSRSLELRIGQIVRGVLMEMLDNQEALVNINGMQVRAKLDAEMPLGRGTLLQVQPGGAGGLVTLKPLADATDALPEEGMKDVLKTFGLSDQKWAMELVRGLKRDGYPIGKDTAAFFNAAAALKPAGVDAESWASAADVAFRRGLKPTETTLASLRQALFGPPVHEELASFRTALDGWLGSGAAKTASPEAAALGQRLAALLAQGASIVAEGEAQLAGEPRAGRGEAAEAARPEAGAAQRDAAAAARTGGEPGRAAADAAPARGDAAAAARAAAQPQAAAGAQQLQPEASRPAAEPAAAARAPAAEERAAAAGSRPAAQDGAAADGRRADGRADAAAAGQQQASAAKPEAAWIGRFLQWLGVGHERQLLHAAEARLPGGLPDAGPNPAAAGTLPGADAPGQEARPAAETLKGALLALAARDDVPPALREAAQTLASQVTGQQLLLSSDRGMAAPLSHMTLFVPMRGENGDTTATVHVQTRRVRRGEWDIDNCHLLFDLRMRHLGDTVVDVQVVDRIVSLKLLSDFPGMAELIEGAREELTEGMSSAGFQLLSLTALPLPQWKPGSLASLQSADHAHKAVAAGAYAAKPYKGVDYRA
ncbi:hypothetical protein B1A99_33390 [Cohnella sp. CIP 111063]|uniref:hypothetical protein n=1 Tax=unclassified Cohnella TaxID=2636738 RepID=UPI000B8BF9A4|nr:MULTISPECIES: hypothetical protein [unclassified Cohnella]OXS52616.1 hypothetical protein B1A99_33390 [Cohnella sp. CIP 111063]PRX58878.1 hypothetical protein B0G52_13350 [Cohnella sp. SGD-V74]